MPPSAGEAAHRSQFFSPSFAAYLAAGAAVDGQRYAAAQRRADAARMEIHQMFSRFDIVLAPSTEGDAPTADSTGDPVFNRMWSLVGNPCVHVPTGRGEGGLPVGVSVIGPRYGDAIALSVAALLEGMSGAA